MMSRLKILVALLVGFAASSAMAVEVAVLRNGFEIRHARSEAQGDNTRLYLDGTPESGFLDVPTAEIVTFQHEEDPVHPALASAAPAAIRPGPPATPVPSEADLHNFISLASDRHQVDADLIASVIRAESGFRTRAVSPKGAQGLMQLMPATAAQLGVTDAFHAESNIDGGTRYLRDLLVRYNDDIPKALAAYNAGPERVAHYGGLPPFRETHAYVARVIRDFNRKKLQDRQKLQAAKAPTPTAKAATQTVKAPQIKPAAGKRSVTRAHPKAAPTVASARTIPNG